MGKIHLPINILCITVTGLGVPRVAMKPRWWAHNPCPSSRVPSPPYFPTTPVMLLSYWEGGCLRILDWAYLPLFPMSGFSLLAPVHYTRPSFWVPASCLDLQDLCLCPLGLLGPPGLSSCPDPWTSLCCTPGAGLPGPNLCPSQALGPMAPRQGSRQLCDS